MNTFEQALTKLHAVQDLVRAFPNTLTGEAEDLKRAELRVGFAGSGLTPKYSKRYGNMKMKLPSYHAPGNRADLFLTGKTHASITTTEKNGLLSNKLVNPPKYAKHALKYANDEELLWTDKGASNFIKMSSRRLYSQITSILNG